MRSGADDLLVAIENISATTLDYNNQQSLFQVSTTQAPIFNRSSVSTLLAVDTGSEFNATLSTDRARSLHHPAFLLLILLNVWTTISNATVIYVMVRTPVLRRRFGCVIVSLSLADLCSSLLVWPLAIYYFSNLEGWRIGGYFCVYWVTADVFFCTASICHHASIAIHRYLAISKPHQFSTITTNTPMILRLILPSWAVGFTIAMILAIQALVKVDIVYRDDSCGLQDRLYLIYSSFVSFFIPLFVIIFVSLKSIFLLRRHLRKRAGLFSSMPKPQLATLLENSRNTPSPSPRDATTDNREPNVEIEHSNEKQVTENQVDLGKSRDEDSAIAAGSLMAIRSPLHSNHVNPNVRFSLTTKLESTAPVKKMGRLRAMSLAPVARIRLPRKSKSEETSVSPKWTSFKSLMQSYLDIGSDTCPFAVTDSDARDDVEAAPKQQVLTSPPMIIEDDVKPKFSHTAMEAIEEEENSTMVTSSKTIEEENSPMITSSKTNEEDNSAGITCSKTTEEDNSLVIHSKTIEEEATTFMPSRVTNRPCVLMPGKISLLSFGSDVMLGNENFADFDLSCPGLDQAMLLSTDDITPSVDNLTRCSCAILDIPSPADENHPLDLRTVFSRNHHCGQFEARTSKTSICLAENAKFKKRKRAYTINLPIRNIEVEQAPIVQAELLGSPLFSTALARSLGISADSMASAKAALSPKLKRHAKTRPEVNSSEYSSPRQEFSEESIDVEISRPTTPAERYQSYSRPPPIDSKLPDNKTEPKHQRRSLPARVATLPSNYKKIGASFRNRFNTITQAALTPFSGKISASLAQQNVFLKKRDTKLSQRHQREKEKQAERVLLFVLFVFVCLWLPFFSTNFLYGLCPSCVYENLFMAFTWLGWSASAINPIVFTMFNYEFKKAFLSMFCRGCGDKSMENDKSAVSNANQNN